MKQNVVGTEYQQSIIGCDNGPAYRSIRRSPLVFFFFKWGFPCSSVGKESACNAGDPGLSPG